MGLVPVFLKSNGNAVSTLGITGPTASFPLLTTVPQPANVGRPLTMCANNGGAVAPKVCNSRSHKLSPCPLCTVVTRVAGCVWTLTALVLTKLRTKPLFAEDESCHLCSQTSHSCFAVHTGEWPPQGEWGRAEEDNAPWVVG